MDIGPVERGVAPPPRHKATKRTLDLREAMAGMKRTESRWLSIDPGETIHMTQMRVATNAMRIWGKQSYRTAQEADGTGRIGVRVWRMKE